LNSVLTVEEGKADSHSKKGWEKFTDAIIQKLNEQTEGVVYLLWGSKAQEKAHKVNTEKNLVLKSVHPSPLSSYRGFFGCKHFSQSNEYLMKMNKEPIIW
jgi:uracil-DNA glycosylase